MPMRAPRCFGSAAIVSIVSDAAHVGRRGDGAQIIIDDEGVRIFTRRGLDWTSKYHDLAKAAGELSVESAIVDGEIIILNEAGLSDLGELRKAITRPQHDLCFVAFDLLHLNGHDLLEDRREILAEMIPKGSRVQFSEALPGTGAAVFHLVDQAGIEGVYAGHQPERIFT